jgi:hypothetical protein
MWVRQLEHGHLRKGDCRMLKATAVFFAFVIAVCVAIGGLGHWSCIIRSPEQEGENTKAQQAYNENCTTSLSVLKFGGTQVIETFHSYHDDINAFSTVVIAVFTCILGIFTISLSRSTRIAADAAMLNARAVMDAEGAHIYPVIETDNLRSDVFYGVIRGESGNDSDIMIAPTVTFRFKNYGKTPAVLKSFMWGITFFEIPSDLRTMYPEDRKLIDVLGAGTETPDIQVEMLRRLTRGNVKSIRENRGKLLFFGEAKFKDFFNRHLRCIWECEGAPDGFRLIKHHECPDPDAHD